MFNGVIGIAKSIKCIRCQEEKSEDDFYYSSTKINKRQSTCKVCDKLRTNELRKLNREHYRAKGRQAHIKFAYGISQEVVDKMRSDQDGRCAICKDEMDDRPKGYDTKRKQVVDHCHSTNQVRGLLCTRCNQALGLFRDNKHILYSAIEYLER